MAIKAAAKPLVVVSSRTGNTCLLAHAICDALEDATFVRADALPENLTPFNPVILAFWCDRGMAPEDMKAAALRLEGKRIACLATLGGDPESKKARDWMVRTSEALAAAGDGNTLLGTFLCRGRIDPKLLAVMSKTVHPGVPPEEAEAVRQKREARRAAAETHPERMDLIRAVDACRAMLPDLRWC